MFKQRKAKRIAELKAAEQAGREAAQQWAIYQTHRAPAQPTLVSQLRNPRGESYPEGAFKIESPLDTLGVKVASLEPPVHLSPSFQSTQASQWSTSPGFSKPVGRFKSPLQIRHSQSGISLHWNAYVWNALATDIDKYVRNPRLVRSKLNKEIRSRLSLRQLIQDSRVFL